MSVRESQRDFNLWEAVPDEALAEVRASSPERPLLTLSLMPGSTVSTPYTVRFPGGVSTGALIEDTDVQTGKTTAEGVLPVTEIIGGGEIPDVDRWRGSPGLYTAWEVTNGGGTETMVVVYPTPQGEEKIIPLEPGQTHTHVYPAQERARALTSAGVGSLMGVAVAGNRMF